MTLPLHLGYCGNRLLREGETRGEATLGEALAHPEAGVFLRAEGLWLAAAESGAPRALFSPAEAGALLGETPVELLLGHTDAGAPRLAAALAPADIARLGTSGEGAERQVAGHPLHDLRTLGMRAALDPDTEGQLAQAHHLLNWHDNARFCGRCGGATVSEAAGFRRRCARCDHMMFPRTDPVSIMLVHDGEGRCLMGRQPHFAPNMWSCLAGFVEAGETVENAVRRETLEEAGIEVGAVRILLSQPWPFPGSLMIGCEARAGSRDIRFDGAELEDCRWFTREEVGLMLDGRHPDGLGVPPPYAIAHHLIRVFAEGREAADRP